MGALTSSEATGTCQITQAQVIKNCLRDSGHVALKLEYTYVQHIVSRVRLTFVGTVAGLGMPGVGDAAWAGD